jgi:hypothetical protein
MKAPCRARCPELADADTAAIFHVADSRARKRKGNGAIVSQSRRPIFAALTEWHMTNKEGTLIPATPCKGSAYPRFPQDAANPIRYVGTTAAPHVTEPRTKRNRWD